MGSHLFSLGRADRRRHECAVGRSHQTICGTIHLGTNPPACGVPLGGLATGCLDLEASGLLGYCTRSAR